MTNKPIRQPGPDHPDRAEPGSDHGHGRGGVVADTSNALTLGEANYPPVQ